MSSNINTITPLELEDEISKEAGNLIIIDVRTKAEREEGFIAPSYHVELSDLEPVNEIVKNNSGKTFYFYCLRGARSMQASVKIKTKFPDLTVCNLTGGISQWIADKCPIETE